MHIARNYIETNGATAPEKVMTKQESPGCLSRLWKWLSKPSTKPTTLYSETSTEPTALYKAIRSDCKLCGFLPLTPSSLAFSNTIYLLQKKGKYFTQIDLTRISEDKGQTTTHMNVESNASDVIPYILKYCPNLRSLKLYSGDLPYKTHCALLKEFTMVIGGPKTTTYSMHSF
jgi:hypothetical protein